MSEAGLNGTPSTVTVYFGNQEASSYSVELVYAQIVQVVACLEITKAQELLKY